jgi:hypothetical protein
MYSQSPNMLLIDFIKKYLAKHIVVKDIFINFNLVCILCIEGDELPDEKAVRLGNDLRNYFNVRSLFVETDLAWSVLLDAFECKQNQYES